MFAGEDSDDSEFGGFQVTWHEGGFVRRTNMNFCGIGDDFHSKQRHF